jgi:hypothetical protein
MRNSVEFIDEVKKAAAIKKAETFLLEGNKLKTEIISIVNQRIR